MQQKARLISNKLTELYPDPPNGFLNHTNEYTLLIGVLLSAQSTDTKVNECTPALFTAADTAFKMLTLGEKPLLEIIRPIGLSPQKSKNIIKLSQILVDQFDNTVPKTFKDLEGLPGVGHKTASVVMSQAFGLPAFPVDTHIHRLACRWGIGDSKSVVRTEAALKTWFPDESSWLHLHRRIILFGREYCPARNHDMLLCHICSFAATDESLLANSSFPKKFVAAVRHARPFSVRSGEDIRGLAEKREDMRPDRREV